MPVKKVLQKKADKADQQEVTVKCSEKLYRRACEVLPGGVNSPVRAFGAVGGVPRFIKQGKGCRIANLALHAASPKIRGVNRKKILCSNA